MMGRGLDQAELISKRSRGTPRLANRFLRRLRDFAEVAGKSEIDVESAKLGLERLSVDDKGLDAMDRRILQCLIRQGGGPVGLKTLAVSVGEEEEVAEDVYEPFLIQRGMLQKTPRAGCDTVGVRSHEGGFPGRFVRVRGLSVAKRRILMHTCCAVCFEAVFPALDGEWEATAFFYNPNIHPYSEFEKRLRAVEVITDSRKAGLVADNAYGLELYLSRILPPRSGPLPGVLSRADGGGREGRELGFGAFTTTLLASSHQKHEEVRAAGEAAGATAGVEFLYSDWRGRLEGIESAKSAASIASSTAAA